jgi:hypothetical protein
MPCIVIASPQRNEGSDNPMTNGLGFLRSSRGTTKRDSVEMTGGN